MIHQGKHDTTMVLLLLFKVTNVALWVLLPSLLLNPWVLSVQSSPYVYKDFLYIVWSLPTSKIYTIRLNDPRYKPVTVCVPDYK